MMALNPSSPGNMQRHPSSQEDGCGYCGDDKQVYKFCPHRTDRSAYRNIRYDIPQSVHFLLQASQTGAAVDFCISGYQINDKSDQCRYMSFKKEPAVSLAFYNFA